MDNILLLDSTTDKLFVGLITAKNRYIMTSGDKMKKHNSALLPAVQKLLIDADITIDQIAAVACNCGAGSFTGIRLGVTTANGLAATGEIKLINMNTFEIAAYNIWNKGLICLLDARHGNFYACRHGSEYCNVTMQELADHEGDIVIAPSCEQSTLAQLLTVHGERVRVASDEDYYSNFFDLAAAKYASGEFITYLAPLYMKESQAERELAERALAEVKLAERTL